MTSCEPDLNSFQDEGYRLLLPKQRGMLLMDMGTGKSPLASKLMCTLAARRILVSCPENAVNVWGREGTEEGWSGLDWIRHFSKRQVIPHFMDEEPWNRKVEWNAKTSRDEIHLYIAVHNTLARDCGIIDFGKHKKDSAKARRLLEDEQLIIKPSQGFDGLIVDEARRVRNHDSALFRGLKKLYQRYNIPNAFYLTGTPTSRGPQDLWTMLHLIDPKRFRGYWNFVNEWCITEENMFGGRDIVEPNYSKMPAFHKMLREHAFVIKEDDPRVLAQRPELTRQKLSVPLDNDQRKLYDEFERDGMSYIPEDDNLLIAPNSLAKMTRLRQIMVCPQILSPNLSVGAAIKDVGNIIAEQRVKLPIVIFTPYTDAFEPFARHLQNRIKGLPITFLKSGISPAEQGKRLEYFRRSEGVAIVSILYAQAFSLEPALKAFFIGCDWDADNNRQAEKRLLRMTTKAAVNSYYYTSPWTLWDRILDILNFKAKVSQDTLPSYNQ